MKSKKPCSAPHCTRLGVGRYCPAHYRRLRDWGALEFVPDMASNPKIRGPRDVPRPPICEIPGCGKPSRQRHRWNNRLWALCNMHGVRIRTHSEHAEIVFDPLDRRRPNHAGTLHGGYRTHTVNGRRIGEHRLVMAQVLGRPLETHEHIHHRNGDKLDNRPDNLVILTNQEHKFLHSALGCQIHNGTRESLLALRARIDDLLSKIR